MYAHVMRKWSLIKLLMLLFLPIMILLFYCQGGVNAMYLNTPRQQIQHQLNFNPYYSPQQNTQNFQGVEEKRYYNNENSNRFLSESNNNNIYNRKVDNYDSKNGDKMDDDSGEEEKKKNLFLIKSDRNLTRSDNNLSYNNNSNSYVNENNPHEIQKNLWIKRMEEKRDRHENFRHMFSRIAVSSSPSRSPSSSSIINQTEYENLNSISSHNNSRHISNLNIHSNSYRNRRDSSSRLNTNNNNNNKRNNNNRIKNLRNKNKLQIKRHTNKSKRRRNQRYCSAQDPETLAFTAPTVFSGKIHSMSSERSSNFYVTFEVQETLKKQSSFTLPAQVRLQFKKTNKIECDIFKEQFRTTGYVNQDFEQRKIYYLFVNQINSRNFTILGQPIKDKKNVTNDINKAITKTYGQNATIVDLKYKVKNVTATKEQLIDENARIRLVCIVKGRPAPKVTWYFNERPIRDLSGYRVETQKWRSVLIIKHAKANNTGEYECRARNKVSKRGASRTIKIRINQKRDNSPNEEISGKSACDVQGFCYNGGTCVLFRQLSEYSCQCDEEYTGRRCQFKVPTNSNSTFTNNNYDDDRLMPMTQMETSIPNDYYAEDVE